MAILLRAWPPAVQSCWTLPISPCMSGMLLSGLGLQAAPCAFSSVNSKQAKEIAFSCSSGEARGCFWMFWLTCAWSATNTKHVPRSALGMLSASTGPLLSTLTEPHIQNPSGSNGLQPVGSHALVVARVCRVQVLDPQPRAIFCLPDDDPPWLLHNRGVILQPPHVGRWISRHLAVQDCCLALDNGDIVDRLQKVQKVACRGWVTERKHGEVRRKCPGSCMTILSEGVPFYLHIAHSRTLQQTLSP